MAGKSFDSFIYFKPSIAIDADFYPKLPFYKGMEI
jgi:hypothetical protein